MDKSLRHTIWVLASKTLKEGHDLGTSDACMDATNALEQIEELLRPLSGCGVCGAEDHENPDECSVLLSALGKELRDITPEEAKMVGLSSKPRMASDAFFKKMSAAISNTIYSNLHLQNRAVLFCTEVDSRLGTWLEAQFLELRKLRAKPLLFTEEKPVCRCGHPQTDHTGRPSMCVMCNCDFFVVAPKD